MLLNRFNYTNKKAELPKLFPFIYRLSIIIMLLVLLLLIAIVTTHWKFEPPLGAQRFDQV